MEREGSRNGLHHTSHSHTQSITISAQIAQHSQPVPDLERDTHTHTHTQILNHRLDKPVLLVVRTGTDASSLTPSALYLPQCTSLTPYTQNTPERGRERTIHCLIPMSQYPILPYSHSPIPILPFLYSCFCSPSFIVPYPCPENPIPIPTPYFYTPIPILPYSRSCSPHPVWVGKPVAHTPTPSW